MIAKLGARGEPAQAFTEFATEHIEQLVQETLEGTSPQPGLPGYREATGGTTKLALQMIDAETSITEPVCLRNWDDGHSRTCVTNSR